MIYAVINNEGNFCQYCDENFNVSEGLIKIELTELELIELEKLKVKRYVNSKWIESITLEEIALRKIERNLELNKLQFDELLVTDWAFIRRLEEDTEIPLEIVNERNEIRAKYSELKNSLSL